MGLAEILAKKRAAAAQPVIEPAKEEEVKLEEKKIEEPVKKEEAAIAAPKALTFAEKMALKKKEEEAKKQATQSTPPVAAASMLDVGLAPTPASADTTTSTLPANSEEILRTGVMDAKLDKNPMPTPEPVKKEDSPDPAVAQAYADIKDRIDQLNAMSEEDLPNAMSQLKKALMQNPSAVALMEDMDIGKMVVALRKITGEAITEAAKEKKPGRKAKEKQIDLTDPNVIAAVMDEL
jgi:hypothetical protein